MYRPGTKLVYEPMPGQGWIFGRIYHNFATISNSVKVTKNLQGSIFACIRNFLKILQFKNSIMSAQQYWILWCDSAALQYLELFETLKKGLYLTACNRDIAIYYSYIITFMIWYAVEGFILILTLFELTNYIWVFPPYVLHQINKKHDLCSV